MRGVILAAGRGGRLRDVTGDLPKCLARVGSMSLLERQLSVLRDHGVSDLTVVGGYGLPHVQRVCGPQAKVVNNPQFATTNSLYSLWLLRETLRDGFVVMNCDVLFHPQLLTDLLTARYADALLMAARGGASYGDEEMKIRLRGGCVVDIAKTIDSQEADGENVGIAKFGADGAAVLIEEMDQLIAAGALQSWLPAAFGAFARRRPLFAVETRGFPWIEIDFPEDYWRASAHVLPALDDGPRPAWQRMDGTSARRLHRHV
jgi:L-glutamine-phosphate cytidylyltransferase